MLPLLMLVAFVLVPIVEIYLFVQVGSLIGGWSAVALLLAVSAVGVWVVRREGRRAWNALVETVARGRAPERELADAAVILIGGALLVFPGFATALAGLVFVLPPTRPLARRLLMLYAARQVRAAERRLAEQGMPSGMFPPGAHIPADHPGVRGPVIRGEVIRED
ncbi:FxsA family protein [Thermomonospora catenispora]|uniref:FxsA family protein n=1 Tax=Thermomonospora catenispora TaxID=2493090 RepID=UPI00111FFF10|nr:FxsA family protein [Thermomonospora catenispora]TNY34802.1 FxsA family protein [Thermomonospora catenispora]